jgi:tRNA-specific 2-thiouridylase
MSETFADTVLADFFEEHAAGRTPNPCARCNEHIKFAAFLDRADQLGMDFVATGHYVRTARDDRPAGAWRLFRGADDAKDQSYMLHMLGQPALERSLFPVGGQTKAETRAHAQRFGLAVAGKPDSQEVCFVPGPDHAEFIEEREPSFVREGEVVDTDGNVVASHLGTHRFTIGQRRGLGVATGERTYVVDVLPAENRVVIGSGDLLTRRGLRADRVSWIAGKPPAAATEPFEAEVRIRYKGEDVPAVVVCGAEDTNEAVVEFKTPQRAVAPGQSVVFYRGDELLGGGRIVSAIR